MLGNVYQAGSVASLPKCHVLSDSARGGGTSRGPLQPAAFRCWPAPGMFTSLARFVGGGAVRAALGHSVAWFATRLKTHKGMAKRVRVTGKGKLKCSAIGRRHRAQSNNGVKVQRLRKTDYITGADAKTIKGMIRAR